MQINTYKQASEIWLQFNENMYAYILNKVHDSESAAEINQQVLTKLLDACCSGKEIKNVSSWIFRIAHNTLVDHLRLQRKQSVLEYDPEQEDTPSVYMELAEYIQPLIGFLPEKYATPLILSDIQGVKQEEIAKQLNLSLSGAKSRIQRARKLLKEEVKTCFHLDQECSSGLEGFRLKDSCEPLKKYISKDL